MRYLVAAVLLVTISGPAVADDRNRDRELRRIANELENSNRLKRSEAAQQAAAQPNFRLNYQPVVPSHSDGLDSLGEAIRYRNDRADRAAAATPAPAPGRAAVAIQPAAAPAMPPAQQRYAVWKNFVPAKDGSMVSYNAVPAMLGDGTFAVDLSNRGAYLSTMIIDCRTRFVRMEGAGEAFDSRGTNGITIANDICRTVAGVFRPELVK
jgi:hypothetical protein